MPSDTTHQPQQAYSHTVYDYLVLVPGLLVAVTPLVLGLLNRRSKNQGKED